MVTESVKDWALIIHADSAGDRVDVYWVDINAGREGLRLAHEVRQWRRRDDLLVIGNRIPIPIPPDNYADQQIEADAALALDRAPAAVPEAPALPPRAPVEASRLASRHEYLAGRVRAILAHSDVAKKALQINWPKGVSGLVNDGQSWEELDLILDAILEVEKNHSVPFYPEWNDPDIEESVLAHPSNVWARPKTTKATDEDREVIATHIYNHKRSELARRWISTAVSGGVVQFDTTSLAHALAEFLNLDESEWNDDDLTLMLDGSLRALGYDGIKELGKFRPEHAPLLMSAAFAIAAGNAMLLFDENENPIVRTNVRKG